MQEFNFAQI